MSRSWFSTMWQDMLYASILSCSSVFHTNGGHIFKLSASLLMWNAPRSAPNITKAAPLMTYLYEPT